MSAINAFETNLLTLIFINTDCANVGDATGLRGSTTAGVFWIGIHTAGVTDAADQTTNEATYTGYTGAGARQSVARSAAGWTVSGGTVDNDSVITYGACTAGTNTIHSFIIGSDQTTAGNAFIWGDLTADLAVSAGVTPSFAAGALDVTLS
jgi:hypothetical protein